MGIRYVFRVFSFVEDFYLVIIVIFCGIFVIYFIDEEVEV